MTLELPAHDCEPVVYFLYNEEDELIYIGSTVDLRSRLAQHALYLREEASRYEVQPCESREQARVREAAAIRSLRPRLNDKHNPDARKLEVADRWLATRAPASIAEAVEEIARRDERSVSWVIRRALRDYVQAHGDRAAA